MSATAVVAGSLFLLLVLAVIAAFAIRAGLVTLTGALL